LQAAERTQEVNAMIDRAKYPTAWQGCEISVVTECLRDGRWAVVAAIQETTPEHTRTIDLPVPSETFTTREEAQAHGVSQAERWLETNMPKSEAA
jgi:hypothetical protein